MKNKNKQEYKPITKTMEQKITSIDDIPKSIYKYVFTVEELKEYLESHYKKRDGDKVIKELLLQRRRLLKKIGRYFCPIRDESNIVNQISIIDERIKNIINGRDVYTIK